MLPLVTDGFLFGALLWAGLLMWRFPAQAALSVFSAVVLLDCVDLLSGGINVGIFIHSDDLACAALICASAILFARHRSLFFGYLCRPALLLLGLAVLNFLRGVLLYGGKPAGNGIRNLVYLVAPFVAISVIGRVGRLNVIRTTIFLCGASLVFTAIALLRWGGILPMPEVTYEDFRQITRVLAADYPMIIGQALIAVVALQLSHGVRTWPMLATLLFGAIVIVSQHRSVWLATATGLAWLAFRSLRVASPKQILQFSGAGVCAATIMLIGVIASGRAELFTAMLKSNVEETKQEDSTLAWRINGYDEALDRAFSGGIFELVLGPPAGRDKDLDEVASIASVHIHNRYIDTFAYYGIVGLALLVAWLWMLTAYVWRAEQPVGRRATIAAPKLVLEGLLISQFAFLMAYAGNMLSGAVLGMLWAAALATPESTWRSGDGLRIDLFAGEGAEALATKQS